jgi:flagellar protein FlaG
VSGVEKPSLDAMRAELQESVRSANERLAVYNQKLEIAIDGATGAIVVKVSDSDTGETLRQIPSEEALRITRNIDSLTGILVDHKE